MNKMTSSEENNSIFLMMFDFSQTSYNALDYLIKLVKNIGGKIELYCILPSTDSNGAAHSVLATKKEKQAKLDALVEMIQLENIPVSSELSIGNFESELKRKLKLSSNKTVVLGNKTGSIGQVCTSIINNFSGNILLINHYCKLQGELRLAIGQDEKDFDKYDVSLINRIGKISNDPITVLKVKGATEDSFLELDKELDLTIHKIENSNIAEELLNYTHNNDIKLLCLGRSKLKNSFLQRIFSKHSKMTNIVKNIQSPLLIMGAIR